MKKRWVLKEEYVSFLEALGVEVSNEVIRLNTCFNEGDQNYVSVAVPRSGVAVGFWRSEVADYIEADGEQVAGPVVIKTVEKVVEKKTKLDFDWGVSGATVIWVIIAVCAIKAIIGD